MKRTDFKDALTAQLRQNPKGLDINKVRMFKGYDPKALKALVDNGSLGVRHDGRIYPR